MEFKKTSLKKVVVHKIKWVLRILNYPFDKLLEWL